MIKAIAFLLILTGFVGLTMGVLGIFGKDIVALHPWALTILGLIFFLGGISLLKRRRDTDEIWITNDELRSTNDLRLAYTEGWVFEFNCSKSRMPRTLAFVIRISFLLQGPQLISDWKLQNTVLVFYFFIAGGANGFNGLSHAEDSHTISDSKCKFWCV